MLLSLRPISHADIDRIHEWASQDAACRYQPWGPNTFADTTAFVETAVKAWSLPDGSRRVWTAFLPDEGVVGLGELKRITPTCREIAYAAHVDKWGHEIRTQIAQLLVEAAFHELGVERVQATCDPRNVRSANVLAKIGMTHEGTLRHTLLLRDGWRDSQIQSILSNEWSSDPARLQRVTLP